MIWIKYYLNEITEHLGLGNLIFIQGILENKIGVYYSRTWQESIRRLSSNRIYLN